MVTTTSKHFLESRLASSTWMTWTWTSATNALQGAMSCGFPATHLSRRRCSSLRRHAPRLEAPDLPLPAVPPWADPPPPAGAPPAVGIFTRRCPGGARSGARMSGKSGAMHSAGGRGSPTVAAPTRVGGGDHDSKHEKHVVAEDTQFVMYLVCNSQTFTEKVR